MHYYFVINYYVLELCAKFRNCLRGKPDQAGSKAAPLFFKRETVLFAALPLKMQYDASAFRRTEKRRKT